MKETALPSGRLPLIDALKALAALAVFFNHLSSYGPLANAAMTHFPGLTTWVFEYGRMAVQVFLVIAGFLAAKGLSPHGEALQMPCLPLLWKRYVRLVLPYMAAVGLAIIAAAIADHWLDDEFIPARASFKQWLAHLFLVHSFLEVDALSAGVWYIAIDFQLFALMACILSLGRSRFVGPAAVLLLGLCALFWFNRQPALDQWAIYFFGSYALGCAAWWASDRKQLLSYLAFICAVGVAALMVEFRWRIALALAVALLLGLGRRQGFLERWPEVPALSWLGQVSYALFLVHFPVLLLANSLFFHADTGSAFALILAVSLTLTVSVAAAALFYRWIESPAASRNITLALARLFASLAPRWLGRLLAAGKR